MSSDLIFPILPRDGKVPMAKDEQRVQEVEKRARMGRLSDEEKELHSEEREAREQYLKKEKKKKKSAKAKSQKKAKKSSKSKVDTTDNNAPAEESNVVATHLDLFV